MSDVKIDSPSDAARDPAHPDHDRWLKDRTLKMETDHARVTGKSYRDAELANEKNLARLAGKRRDDTQTHRGPPRPAGEKNDGNAARWAEREAKGITRRPAIVRKVPPSACRNCGRCKRCKRDARVVAIQTKARQQDVKAVALAWDLAGALLAMKGEKDYRGGDGRLYAFSIIPRERDKLRAFHALVESVCDRSVSFLGQWR